MMGRSYTEPEVMEAEGGFYIGRIKDPDDEFASSEVLAHGWEGSNLDPTFVGWEDERYIAHRDVVLFARRSEAEQALMFYRAGQESVRAIVVIEG